MLEQANVEIIWYAHFTSDGEGKTGLAPTLTVYKNDGATPEVDAQSMTELADGLYYYQQTPSDEGFRVAVAKTADESVDQKHLPALMGIGKAGVERLDAEVSSRAAASTAAQEATLTEIQGAGWSAESDSLDHIRQAVDNVPTHRETQEI
jgi:hypothetical protein